jgi:hypothetical protein
MAVISISEPGTQSAKLELDRGDISFWNVARNRVRIEVVVHNRGTVRSEPTPIDTRSAPLGAFLPWQPLGRFTVSPIVSGSQVRLHTEVHEAPVASLGEPSRVPPAELLTAVGAADFDGVTDSARNLVS